MTIRALCSLLISIVSTAGVAFGATPTTTQLSVSKTALRFGETLTLTANVSVASSGTVTFYDGVNVIAIEPVSSGTATAKTSALAAGSHTVFARYHASPQYATSVSSKIPVTVTTLAATDFDPLPPFGPITGSTVLLVADLNNDQIPDLVVGSVGSSSTVWLGNGDGTFRPPPQPLQNAAVSLIGDFNNDGIPDLLAEVPQNDSTTAHVLLGAGDGTFTALATSPPQSGNTPFYIVGDFNGDGNLDLLGGYGGLSTWLGNGDGTFQTPIPSENGAIYISGVSGADFNGDGITDLLFYGYYDGAVQLGNGDGTFSPAPRGLLPIGLDYAVIADFNNDGKLDVYIPAGSPNGSVYLGNGDGTFQSGLATGAGYTLATDVNGDGKIDLLSANQIGYGNGDGTFQSPVNYSGGVSAAPVVASLDGKGQVDLIGVNQPIYIALGSNLSSVTLTAAPSPAAQSSPITLIATVTPPSATGVVTFYDGSSELGSANLAAGKATLTVNATYAGNRVLSAQYAGDDATQPSVSQPVVLTVNGTASSTILTGSDSSLMLGQPVTFTVQVSPATSGKVTFFDGANIIGSATLQSGSATFTTSSLLGGHHAITAQYEGGSYAPSTSAPFNVAVTASGGSGFLTQGVPLPVTATALYSADFNGDGSQDLLALSQTQITVLLASGPGTFTTAATYSIEGSYVEAALLGDINQDGKVDFVLESGTGFGFAATVYLGNGDGTFAVGSTIPGDLVGAVLMDVNRDGMLDLVTATGATVSVFLGKGDGNFQAPILVNWNPSAAGVTITAIALADANHDGGPDLLIASGVTYQSTSNISLLLNNGSGLFGAPQPLFTLPLVSSISTADFNHDGYPDLSIDAFGSIYCFLGNGNSGFAESFTYSTFDTHQLIADVNGDGNPDLIVGGSLFLGNGDGTFQAPTFQNSLGVGAIGDFFKTGRTSIAVPGSNGNTNNISFYSFALLTPITLSVSPSPAALGTPVTLTANVYPPSASGTVSFYDGPLVIGSAQLSSGVATLTTSSLTASVHYLAASYAGDTNDPASYTPYQDVIITGTATSATLTSSAPQVTYGHPVVFTATMSPLSAIGTVRLYNGTQLLASAPLTQGVAVFTLVSLPPGQLSIRAVYQGLSPYMSSTSNALSESVSTIASSAFLSADQIPEPGSTIYASGDFNGDGILDFIASPGNNSNTFGLLLGQTDGTFHLLSTNVYRYSGLTALPVAVDVNGDGLSDLVFPSLGQSFVNQGNGQFVLSSYFSSSIGCAAADFNRDGMPDLICLADDLTLLPEIALPNGAFIQVPNNIQPPVTNGATPSVITADFNGDGKADFAVSNYGVNSIGVFLGNGDGTFRAPLIVSAGTSLGELVSADLNQDGKADLVVLAASGSNVLTVLGNGDGTFQSPAVFPGVNQATSLAVTDFNGDGKQDVFVQSATQLAVLLGNGDGTLQGQTLFPQTTPFLAPFDFNGDGRVDLPLLLGAINDSVAVTSSNGVVTAGQTITLTATVLPSTLTGTVTFFDGGVVLGTSSITNGAATLTVALPADGDQNISAQFNGLSGYISSVAKVLNVGVTALSGGNFSAAVNYSVGKKPSAIVSADFNHDGKPDLAVANSSDNTVTILWGNGQGGFGTPLTLQVGTNPTLLATADFNGDGIPDLAVGNAGSNSISIFLSGNGTLTAGTPILLAFSPLGLAVTDLNADGFVDLLPTGTYNQVPFLGNGTGTFTPAPANFSTFNSGPTIPGDFNGDGLPDIFTSQQVNLNLSQGLFTSYYALANVGVVSAVADFNNDGKSDFVAIPSYLPGALVGISQGNASFSQAVYPLSQTAVNFAAGDFNGDGFADIAIAHANSTVGLMLNHGDGTFSPESTFSAGSGPVALAVGDFNGDGRLDLAVANSTGNDVSILLGAAPPSCTFTVSPSLFNFSSAGGSATINITASSSTCSWSANYVEPGQTHSFPQLTSNGSGSGSFTWQLPGNFSSPYSATTPQTAYIYVAGTTIPVYLAQTAQTFADVLPSAYYFDAINLLSQNGITSGCGENPLGQAVFCPTESVTRDEMAVFLVRAIFRSANITPSTAAPYFADIPSDYWAFNFIQRMYELGITQGCGTNAQGQLLFCPLSVVTRDQMAIFLIRARYGTNTSVDFPSTPFFADVPADYWAFAWIQRLRLDNITQGCAATLYCPTNPVLRGDMAIFLMRGLLNQLLPATEPILTGNPQEATRGTSDVSLGFTGLNTNFVQGITQIVLPPNSGVTLNSLIVESSTVLAINIDVAAGALPGPLPVYVISGTEEAVLPNGLVLQ